MTLPNDSLRCPSVDRGDRCAKRAGHGCAHRSEDFMRAWWDENDPKGRVELPDDETEVQQ